MKPNVIRLIFGVLLAGLLAGCAPSYRDVRDAADWQNPYLVVLADGCVLLHSTASPNKKLPVEELKSALVALPASAWPYGKVIALQENSVRAPGDDALIKKNREAIERLLNSLGLKIQLWPTA